MVRNIVILLNGNGGVKNTFVPKQGLLNGNPRVLSRLNLTTLPPPLLICIRAPCQPFDEPTSAAEPVEVKVLWLIADYPPYISYTPALFLLSLCQFLLLFLLKNLGYVPVHPHVR